MDQMKQTIDEIVSNNRGILAMDESFPNIERRFEAVGISNTPENRADYREMLITTPDLGKYIGGAILFDETVYQEGPRTGKPIIELLQAQGIVPGIKVDKGAKDFSSYPGEKITEGLDGLRERFKEYKSRGMKFSKWRSVFYIDIERSLPSYACVSANATQLALYALLSQEAEIVPIVEPEVERAGSHSIDECAGVTERVLEELFEVFDEYGVNSKRMILKPSFIVPGKDWQGEVSVEEVADKTYELWESSVPVTVLAVMFLSGGIDELNSMKYLNELNLRHGQKAPWVLGFSYSRALQGTPMKLYAEGKYEEAQQSFLARARAASLARAGKFDGKI